MLQWISGTKSNQTVAMVTIPVLKLLENIYHKITVFPSGTQTKILHSLNQKKATGPDKIPPKLIKMAKPVISDKIAGMINNAIVTGTFPDTLKRQMWLHYLKKAYHLIKENYRPSILPCLSKVYEKVLAIQIGEYFENIFDQALSFFRAGYSCQDTLLSLVEKWKMSLRDHKHAGAILMDLRKAFDCMPHGLLLAKLEAYSFSENSI